MSRRDPNDYNREDVDCFVAQPNGYSLDQILVLDFPKPDYTDESGASYWTMETVVAWLEGFHTALLAIHRAEDPEDFERLMQLMKDLHDSHDQEGWIATGINSRRIDGDASRGII